MKYRRTLLAILAVSLVANAFFIGYLGSQFYGRHAGENKSRYLSAVGMRLTKNLDASARKQVMSRLDEALPQYRALSEGRREAYAKLRDLLAAPQPDRAAIEALLADMRQKSAVLQVRVMNWAVDAVADLPAEQRRSLGNKQ